MTHERVSNVEVLHHCFWTIGVVDMCLQVEFGAKDNNRERQDHARACSSEDNRIMTFELECEPEF
jgi:hypothetical protein